MHVNVVGQPILVVGSAKVAYDLFERKSSIYSGRANSTMIIDLYACPIFAPFFLTDRVQDGLGMELRNDELRRAVEAPSQAIPPAL